MLPMTTASRSSSPLFVAPPESPNADVGLIGLAVMGQNLVLNMADHGFRVAVFNRTTAKAAEFVGRHPAGSFVPAPGGDVAGGVDGYERLEHFVAALRRPRKVVILVKAGAATRAVIEQLAGLLEPGDIVVDGGNAHWLDTAANQEFLADKGVRFVGSGVSGGEEGARFGPSLMPGGDESAWSELKPIWSAIAAKVDEKTGRPLGGAGPGRPVVGGEPCTAWIGPGGAGHFVKMVHNGIEYADMQMIAEAYHLLRVVGGLTPGEAGEVFARWNEGELDSFLIEITADILRFADPRTGSPFVDVVLDAAQQKGTGKWTSSAALEFGAPASTIAEAVFARFMSALKDERVAAAGVLQGPSAEQALTIARQNFGSRDGSVERFVDAVGEALYCAKICSYAQGFQLMASAASEYDWPLDYGRIASIWRGGCIIRARFLQKITEAFDRDGRLKNLLLDPYFAKAIEGGGPAWRQVVAASAVAGVPAPAFGSALAYFDSYRSATLPANLIQAQRDYFGAHSYERTDEPRGAHFHIDWPKPDRPELNA
jgi:6-phosphogluconate dehydrogenase